MLLVRQVISTKCQQNPSLLKPNRRRKLQFRNFLFSFLRLGSGRACFQCSFYIHTHSGFGLTRYLSRLKSLKWRMIRRCAVRKKIIEHFEQNKCRKRGRLPFILTIVFNVDVTIFTNSWPRQCLDKLYQFA